MELHVVESSVRGFHVYQDIWTPATGERLACQAEDGNDYDPYAVAIRKGAEVIGHVPRKISAACSHFVQRGGTLTCVITDSRRQYSADLPQGGLQIPCKLEFHSNDADLLSIVKKLVKSVSPIEFESKRRAAEPVSKRKLEVKPEDSSAAKKCKKIKTMKVIDLEQSSQSSRDLAREELWASYGRCTLTAVDKSIILKGMIFVFPIKCIAFII